VELGQDQFRPRRPLRDVPVGQYHRPDDRPELPGAAAAAAWPPVGLVSVDVVQASSPPLFDCHREAIVPGPPPAPEASRRRRNHTPAARQLPAAGRPGAAPSWPLTTRPADDEVSLWDELWASPQAVAWQDMGAGLARVVARYVRWTVAAEIGIPADVATSALAELRQLEDRLGLTPMALARLRWDIVAEGSPPSSMPAEPSAPPSPAHPGGSEAPLPGASGHLAPRRPRVRAQDTG
jgi:hypothetical protein